MRTLAMWAARFRNHNSRQGQNMQQAAFPRPNRRGPIEACKLSQAKGPLCRFPRPNRRQVCPRILLLVTACRVS